ncbi:MAG: type II toxin-antitoxin system RelE/ParE family toxin [Bacillota bacterium]|jgi:hypothetical protein
MRYWFHPDAEIEFNDAIDFFEEKATGLGYDFSIEVHSAIKRVILTPSAWPILDGDIRRCLVKRFPYGVLYSQEKEGILIVAVMHLHKSPDYWKQRV